ncbi:hypothetical protein K501DRAFT_330291 [Backusella circina FSU 941]|nr:hypothetical protein K501DRAFT_330291 [Backusella circina FSU 941]
METVSVQDRRVPTFIPYEVTANGEIKQKRKRKVQDLEKRKKKQKTVKKESKEEFKEVKQKKKEQRTTEGVWIGVMIKDDLGAYSIYFSQGDERNSSEVFDIKSGLQNEDYASVLGVCSALEKFNASNIPLTVYTGCRELPRVVSGQRGLIHYADWIQKIKSSLQGKEDKISVRHLSNRVLSAEQSAAMNLASETLSNKTRQVEDESILNTVEQVNILSIRTKNPDTVMEEANFKRASEGCECVTGKDEKPSKESVTSSKPDPEVNMKVPGEPKPSFWSSAFGMKSVFEALASPFKFRK